MEEVFFGLQLSAGFVFSKLLEKLINLSVPQFSHMQKGNNICI